MAIEVPDPTGQIMAERAREAAVFDAVDRVILVIRNEGRVPAFHRYTMAQHRQEWPVLWEALDLLVASKAIQR